jgi:hypothetical protein
MLAKMLYIRVPTTAEPYIAMAVSLEDRFSQVRQNMFKLVEAEVPSDSVEGGRLIALSLLAGGTGFTGCEVDPHCWTSLWMKSVHDIVYLHWDHLDDGSLLKVEENNVGGFSVEVTK